MLTDTLVRIKHNLQKEHMDVMFIGALVLFVALCGAAAAGCDRLRSK